MNYYEISEETARTAHSMVHMSDYKLGSATDGYRAAVDEAAALVASKKAEVSPFYHDKLDALLDRYAREILTEQLAAYQKALDDAKAANAFYRKNKTLDGCPGITPKEKAWLTSPGVFAKGDGTPLALYGCPFPAYELQSRRGYIKRVADRLAELDKRQAQQAQPTENEKFDGGEIVRNLEADRLQIIFDEKPDEETRSVLKSNGFRWSPRYGAWQRQLTRNAEYAARCVLKAISKTAGGDSPC